MANPTLRSSEPDGRRRLSSFAAGSTVHAVLPTKNDLKDIVTGKYILMPALGGAAMIIAGFMLFRH